MCNPAALLGDSRKLPGPDVWAAAVDSVMHEPPWKGTGCMVGSELPLQRVFRCRLGDHSVEGTGGSEGRFQ